MKITLFLSLIMILCMVRNAECYGASTFYAQFILTNLEYGVGAAFNCAVWFNDNGSNFRRMRVDYYSASGTTFQQEMFDFYTHDKYQTCGGTCKHQTYNSAAPSFNTASGFVSLGSCPTPQYTAVSYCPSNCLGYQSSPNQPQGVNLIGFNPTSPNAPCLIQWTVQSGYNYTNEWHVTSYYTTTPYPKGDPSQNSTYAAVINGLTCPQPTCNSLVDIALVLDETGSISAAHAYPAVQQFALGVVNAFNGSFGPNATRMGLTYFSGLIVVKIVQILELGKIVIQMDAMVTKITVKTVVVVGMFKFLLQQVYNQLCKILSLTIQFKMDILVLLVEFNKVQTF
jgi:hypothetical protein